MLSKFLTSLGLLTMIVAACDPEVLVARQDPGDYEVVTLIAD